MSGQQDSQTILEGDRNVETEEKALKRATLDVEDGEAETAADEVMAEQGILMEASIERAMARLLEKSDEKWGSRLNTFLEKPEQKREQRFQAMDAIVDSKKLAEFDKRLEGSNRQPAPSSALFTSASGSGHSCRARAEVDRAPAQ